MNGAVDSPRIRRTDRRPAGPPVMTWAPGWAFPLACHTVSLPDSSAAPHRWIPPFIEQDPVYQSACRCGGLAGCLSSVFDVGICCPLYAVFTEAAAIASHLASAQGNMGTARIFGGEAFPTMQRFIATGGYGEDQFINTAVAEADRDPVTHRSANLFRPAPHSHTASLTPSTLLENTPARVAACNGGALRRART